MQLKISNDYPKEFVADLKKLLEEELYAQIDIQRIEYFKAAYNLDIMSILLYAIKTMLVRQSPAGYVCSLDETVRYKKYNLARLVKKITYGDLTTKGYPVLENVFRDSEKNISVLYGRWLDN